MTAGIGIRSWAVVMQALREPYDMLLSSTHGSLVLNGPQSRHSRARVRETRRLQEGALSHRIGFPVDLTRIYCSKFSDVFCSLVHRDRGLEEALASQLDTAV